MKGPDNRCSGIWKGIISVKEVTLDEVRYRVGSGERILFWLDRWLGDRPLVFNCARDKEAKLQDYLERRGGQVVWGPTLRRNLTETEERQLVDLLRFLQNVQCSNL